MYELVQFNNIFGQTFWNSFRSFFLVFPSRRLSVTFDIQTYLKMKHSSKVYLKANSEGYSEPCQTSKMNVFAKIVTANIFPKSSILVVWQGPEFASVAGSNLRKKLHLRRGQGFEFSL